MFGGKTLLKWKEPRETWRYYKQHISLPRRLMLQHGGPFLGGVALGFILVLSTGWPVSSEGLRRTLLAALIASFGFGVLLVIMNGLVALVSPRWVHLNQKHVMQSYGEN